MGTVALADAWETLHSVLLLSFQMTNWKISQKQIHSPLKSF